MSGKTETILLNLSRERANEIGLRVEHLIKTDMRYIVNRYISQYRLNVADTFGWTREDLLQQIRITMWKGLATFDESKNFKVTTYLSAILFNYFMSLSKKCRSLRNSQSKLYCVENIFDSQAASDDMVDDWVSYTNSLKELMENLSLMEIIVLKLQIEAGYGVTTISEKLKLKKPVVIGIIKSVKRKLKLLVQEQQNEEDSI